MTGQFHLFVSFVYCGLDINLINLNTFSFADSMFICLNQICGYTDLCHEAEQLRKEPYSSDNESHEKRLMQVTLVTDWKFLFL